MFSKQNNRLGIFRKLRVALCPIYRYNMSTWTKSNPEGGDDNIETSTTDNKSSSSERFLAVTLRKQPFITGHKHSNIAPPPHPHPQRNPVFLFAETLIHCVRV